MVIMVSVALSFSLLGFIVSSSILAGFKLILQDSVINTYGHIIVKPAGNDKYISNASQVTSRLKELSHVTSVATRTEFPIQVSYKEVAIGTLGAGVNSNYEKEVSVVVSNVIAGSFIENDSEDNVVLGKSVADDLDGISDDGVTIAVGSKVQVITSSGRHREYEVAGITDTKNIVSNRYVYFSQKESNNLLSLDNQASVVLVKLDSTDQIDNVESEIKKLNLPVRSFSWNEQARYVQDLIVTFSVVSNLINGISLLAAATVMFVVISINAERKRKEIATFRSLGANSVFIISFLMAEAAIYTFLSALVSIPIFGAIHRHFASKPLELILGDLRTVVNPDLMLWSATLFFAITLIAGIYPAWHAAKKIPIRTLWRG